MGVRKGTTRGRRIRTSNLGAAVVSTALCAGLATPGDAGASVKIYFSYYSNLAGLRSSHRSYWTTLANNNGQPDLVKARTDYNDREAYSYRPIGTGWVACAQEYVNLSFYDGPDCAGWPNNVYTKLNGANYDQPLCWDKHDQFQSTACGVSWTSGGIIH